MASAYQDWLYTQEEGRPTKLRPGGISWLNGKLELKDVILEIADDLGKDVPVTNAGVCDDSEWVIKYGGQKDTGLEEKKI